MVALAPWLTGHTRRLRFLLASQHQDGGWGGPHGYGLVPTLSATDALLTSVLRPCDDRIPDLAGTVRAIDRGLRALFGWLNDGGRVSLPDTVAVELIVPALVTEINARLDQLASHPSAGLGTWRGTARLAPPRDIDVAPLERLREAVRRGHGLPEKLSHTLEVIGAPIRGAAFVHPVNGGVGCSPASTAAWLGERAPMRVRHPSVGYLEAVQARHAGPVPVAAPITLFERAWVLTALTTAGISVPVPRASLEGLHAAFGEFGAAVGPGLPPDSDDTATALHALAQLGSPRSPDCLWNYQQDRHFSCYPQERTPSTSANAHILQAFGSCQTHRFRYRDVISGLVGWLREHQEPDGNWWDKWHASPYYATACCAAALGGYGGVRAQPALRKAVEWVLGTQRADGSWGRWTGTYEETAYAVRILLRMPAEARTDAIRRAAARGCLFLLRSGSDQEQPPLWHDKDLYTPVRVVRAEGLAALHLARELIPEQRRSGRDGT